MNEREFQNLLKTKRSMALRKHVMFILIAFRVPDHFLKQVNIPPGCKGGQNWRNIGVARCFIKVANQTVHVLCGIW